MSHTGLTLRPAEPPPPSERLTAWAWARRNLFGGVRSTIVTLLLLLALAWVAVTVGSWAHGSARWGVITDNLRLFLIGLYPPAEAWRPWLVLVLVSGLIGLSAGTWGGPVRTAGTWLAAAEVTLAGLILVSPMGAVPALAVLASGLLVIGARLLGGRVGPRGRSLRAAWLLSLPLAWLILAGGPAGLLEPVPSDAWGGLLLTLVLATVSIVLAFPVGVLLALGRRSSLPGIRIVCTAWIELVRGVPLVTIIYLADIMLPLFLPGDVRIDRVARAIGGLTLFCAAYVAENVRGGLQAIPRGQVEAAQALGLGTIAIHRRIILPQALRMVIPANVGLFLSLLKDTTLVIIIGLLELLGVGRAVLSQPEWQGAQLEVYVFVAGVFFLLCWTISQASYRLEAVLGVGRR